jgi:hypothetical protein
VKTKITFDKDCTDFILNAFGMDVGRHGKIVDKKTRQYIDGLDGKPVYYHEFAGIVPTERGPRLLRGDICSLMKASDLGLI